MTQTDAMLWQREKRKMEREIALLKETIERSSQTHRSLSVLRDVLLKEKSMQEKYMSLLLDNCPDIIILLNEEGCFVNCTKAFLKCARIANFGLIHMKSLKAVLEQCVCGDDCDEMLAVYRQSVKEKRSIEHEKTMDFGFRGNDRRYQITFTPMQADDGSIEGALGLFHDITELSTAKQQAERANAAKTDFLATVSHEIRTPMNAVMGLTDLLLKTEATDQQRGYLNNIQISSRSLLRLINDILDFSKIEANHQEVMRDYFSLADMLDDLKGMFDALFIEKKIMLKYDFSPELPKSVLGDEKLLRQILTNLLTNALKYTREGTVWFAACPGTHGEFEFTVKDTGMGIKKEDLPRLFNAFEQLDRVKNKNIVGTGLGLTITKHLCEILDGSIQVDSEYGVGSVFTVRIPMEPGGELIRQAVENIQFQAPGAKVLVVDDIELNTMITAAMLETFQIKADEANNGEAAIDMAKKKPYDIIFMDHMMPVMDGVETTAHIRRLLHFDGHYQKAPIVALTANAGADSVKMFLASGMTDYVFKPLEETELAKCLVKHLPKTIMIY